ncbi:cytidine deaminase [Aquabacter spiritensis]|uniref:cytidine deaminase n=1 Tax=Aquabacter spiritensis TaxID=933073 RepID=UPI001FE16F7D|nr:cytidine deaminase [Aquabacter spiritensis]
MGLDALLDAAKSASMHAYAPYSRFKVGAALLSAGGGVYVGCNVENVAYPIGTCAEAAAIAAARVAEGETLSALAIAIYAIGSDGLQAPCSPCGACRQRIIECNPDMTVHFFAERGTMMSLTARELLPYSFTF